MIPRYTLSRMREIWDRTRKYEGWLKVELVVLDARAELGIIYPDVSNTIAARAKVNPERIEKIDKEIEHDFNAFIEDVQMSLEEAGFGQYKGEFHRGLTSYDTEDPAFVLQLREAVTAVHDELVGLEQVLLSQANEHKWTYMIARTHGQYAEPTTFGHLMLVYALAVRRSRLRLQRLLNEELSESKISGAVGNYAGMDPRIEGAALRILGLRPALAETQIIQRDRHAAVMNAMAVAASTMEQIARTLWEMMRSEVRELEEPRKPKQKGSSAMAHKKNPIVTERIKGMARLVRAYAMAEMESVATPEFRDISQSCVERVAFVDGTTLTHYMAVKLRWIVDGMKVFTEAMGIRLMERTCGVWAGQQVRNALMDAGVEYETAYRYVQAASFEATDGGFHLLAVLQSKHLSEQDMRTAESIVGRARLKACFDVEAYVRPGIEHIFKQLEQ